MNKSLFRGSLGLMLALMLVLCALPLSALAVESENSELPLTELKAADVTLDQTEFEFRGSPIQPNVTVRTNERLLTLDQDYTLHYENNVEVGTGTVIVSGLAASPDGYTGTVEIPFYINEKSPEFTLMEIRPDDVTINGREFAYTGQSIAPAVTVTIDGKTLTPGQDYTIEYQNNREPGTGTVILRGIAAASESVGYCGEVSIDFTITTREAPSPRSVTEAPSALPVPDDTNPKTGDPFPLHMVMAVMFVSLTGLIGSGYAYFRKIRK